MVVHKVLVGGGEALLKIYLRCPAQGVEARAVHPLAWSAIGLAGIKYYLPCITHGVRDMVCQLNNGHVRAAADVDVALHGLHVLVIQRLGQLHDMQTGSGHVIHIQELTARRARAPNGNPRRLRYLGLMEPPDERGNDVTVLLVVVVARAIEVGGHNAAVVNAVAVAVLAVVTFAQLNASNFGDGIGLISGL